MSVCDRNGHDVLLLPWGDTPDGRTCVMCQDCALLMVRPDNDAAERLAHQLRQPAPEHGDPARALEALHVATAALRDITTGATRFGPYRTYAHDRAAGALRQIQEINT